MQVRRYTTSELTLRFWAAFLLLLTFSAIFIVYVYAEKRIDTANEQRVFSLKVIGELRQSSDDLSRMARSYIATGEHRYKNHFDEIIAIRNGQAARPINYYQVYWDLVDDNNLRPRPAGSRIALLDLAENAGFTPTELAALQQAKIQSDALALNEIKAMQLLERPETDPVEKAKNKEQALLAVFDQNYHTAKKAIMQPVATVYSLVDERTADEVEDAMFYALTMRIKFVCTSASNHCSSIPFVRMKHAGSSSLCANPTASISPCMESRACLRYCSAWFSSAHARMVSGFL